MEIKKRHLNHCDQFGLYMRSILKAVYFIMWWSDIRRIKRTCT